MPAYSELELAYARPLANAILNQVEFRTWALAGTNYESHAKAMHPIEETQRRLRSRTMQNPFWFNYWCGKDSRCICRMGGTGIETDILLIFDYTAGRRLGLHIEIKRPNDTLRKGQAEAYPRRAACWANPDSRPKSVPPYQDFLTMLVCGAELKADRRTVHFDKVISHEEVAQKVQPYPEAQPSQTKR